MSKSRDPVRIKMERCPVTIVKFFKDPPLIIDDYFVHIRAKFKHLFDPGHAQTGKARLRICFLKGLKNGNGKNGIPKPIDINNKNIVHTL